MLLQFLCLQWNEFHYIKYHWRPTLASETSSEDWKPFKNDENSVYIMLKALFVFEMFTFFFSFFGFVEKRLDKKAVINFKTYEVTDWTANNYNIHINQYRKITRNKDHQATKFGQLIKYSVRIIFFFFSKIKLQRN